MPDQLLKVDAATPTEPDQGDQIGLKRDFTFTAIGSILDSFGTAHQQLI